MVQCIHQYITIPTLLFYGDFGSGSQQQYTQNISGTSGSYGSQLIVGQTSIALPYTLQDTNVSPNN
jgi:hypothetical protein